MQEPIKIITIMQEKSNTKREVYTVQVFASNKTLLLWFGLPFTWQRRAGTPETANVWNQVAEWNLLKPQTGKRSACKHGEDANADAGAS